MRILREFMKKTVFGFLTVILLVSLVPVSAAAAGAQQFDYEKSGVRQEYVYRGSDGEWNLEQLRSYDYYPDGTLRTVTSTEGYWHYEGHYDPHGNLMDPTYTFFAGFVDGVMLDPSAEPIREYDGQGRLTYFEARYFLFDNPDSVAVVKESFEYDSQNRASRVTEFIEDEFQKEPAVYTRLFSYDTAGGYTIIWEPQNNAYTNDVTFSRTAFTYDVGHRLVRYEYSSESIYEDGTHHHSSEAEHFTYDKDGLLVRREKYYWGEDFADGAVDETEYRYSRKDNKTLNCEVCSRDYESGKMEVQQKNTYLLDAEGRVVRETYPGYEILHSYNEPAKLPA